MVVDHGAEKSQAAALAAGIAAIIIPLSCVAVGVLASVESTLSGFGDSPVAGPLDGDGHVLAPLFLVSILLGGATIAASRGASASAARFAALLAASLAVASLISFVVHFG